MSLRTTCSAGGHHTTAHLPHPGIATSPPPLTPPPWRTRRVRRPHISPPRPPTSASFCTTSPGRTSKPSSRSVATPRFRGRRTWTGSWSCARGRGPEPPRGDVCRRKMKMSGFSKVEMSGSGCCSSPGGRHGRMGNPDDEWARIGSRVAQAARFRAMPSITRPVAPGVGPSLSHDPMSARATCQAARRARWDRRPSSASVRDRR